MRCWWLVMMFAWSCRGPSSITADATIESLPDTAIVDGMCSDARIGVDGGIDGLLPPSDSASPADAWGTGVPDAPPGVADCVAPGTPTVISAPSAMTEAVGPRLVRAGNGHYLAVWFQKVEDMSMTLAAEYDGVTWGPPRTIATGIVWVKVAADEDSFVILTATPWQFSFSLARWTGAGLGPATQIGNGASLLADSFHLASDGARFMFAYSDPSQGLQAHYMTSDDGVAWSTPLAFGGLFQIHTALEGGPAGFVATTSNGNAQARVFDGTEWSPPVELPHPVKAVVGTTTALFVTSKTGRAYRWSAGTWTDSQALPPIPIHGMLLANQDDDYRIDFLTSYPDATIHSTVQHEGVWSPYVTSPGIRNGRLTTTTCGAWTLVYDDSAAITRAAASSAYSPGRDTGVGAPYMIRGPDRIDAVWSAPSATSNGIPVIHVQFGL